MNGASVFRILVSVAIGVWLQFWAIIFAFWYGDVLNDVVCNSSFYGRPECSEQKIFESELIWMAIACSLVFGGTIPAYLLGARRWQILFVFVITPLLTAMLFLIPVLFVIGLLVAGN